MAQLSNSGEQIDLATALEMVRAYRSKYPQNPKAFLVNSPLVQRILDQPDCAGIRIYQGLNKSGVLSPVLVGVNSQGEDMTDGILTDKMGICPPICAESSILLT